MIFESERRSKSEPAGNALVHARRTSERAAFRPPQGLDPRAGRATQREIDVRTSRDGTPIAAERGY